MKTISEANNKKTVSIQSFDGIRNSFVHKDSTGCTDLVNFRIRQDGSLQKREGYRYLTSISGSIRSIWSGRISGDECCYILAGSTLYKLNKYGTPTSTATASTSSGTAELFFFRERLYLIDGSGLYYLNGSSLSSPEGYVPLVGKNWHSSEIGEINEPRNILCDRARFSYVTGDDPSPIFFVDAPITSVDAVFVNGEQIDSARYSIFSNNVSFYISDIEAYDTVTAYVTYAQSHALRSAILRNTRAIVFGGAIGSRPFLWGNPISPSVMCGSVYVPEESVLDAQKGYPNSDALYFPEGGIFSVGDGQYTVRAVSRHYDRMLIFTEGGAWMAHDADNAAIQIPVMSINSKVGVLSSGAVAELDNQPCTVGCDGIYRWNSDTDELNDCNAYCISSPIAESLGDDFFQTASVYANRKKRELWFAYPNSTDSVWVYFVDKKAWGRYEGIPANRFFDFYGKTAFAASSTIYLLEDSLYADNGKEISAVFESNLMEFDTESKKQLMGVELSHDSGSVSAQLFCNSSSTAAKTLSFTGSYHTREFKRVSLPRFSNIRVRLTAGGTSRQILHSLSVKIR